ncbi:MAG: DUF2752 domain-containing protein [Thermoguttaceae bacterium]
MRPRAQHHDANAHARRANAKQAGTLCPESRLLLAAASIGLAALLSIARTLEPNPLGRGTHLQLGLPQCAFEVLFGHPCPACGMTTAWAHVARGDAVAGLRANISGAVAALLAIAAVPWWLACAATGRWLLWSVSDRAAILVTLTLVLVALAQWGWRLLAG